MRRAAWHVARQIRGGLLVDGDLVPLRHGAADGAVRLFRRNVDRALLSARRDVGYPAIGEYALDTYSDNVVATVITNMSLG